MKRRYRLVHDILRDKEIWVKIFQHVNLPVEAGDNLELEYRKAFQKHNFDYLWHCDMQKIEFEHHAIMGAIIEYAKNKPNSADNEEESKVQLQINIPTLHDPLLLSKNIADYSYDIDLPFLKDLSSEMMLVLCSKYRVNANLEPSDIDVKLQRILDQTQGKIRGMNR